VHVHVLPRWGFKFQTHEERMQFEWLIVVIKCSLIVYWLLKKSEKIRKKTNQSRMLNSIFHYRLTGAAAKNGNSLYSYQKCLSNKTFSCSDVSGLIKSIGKSIDVKVSPILFEKVSVLVSAILSAQSIGIVIGNTFRKPVCRTHTLFNL